MRSLFGGGPYPWLVPGVFTGALAPLAVMGWRAWGGHLGADPVSVSLNQLGLLALVCLTATLACTPIKLLTGWTWPLRLRKTLGLFAFFYAASHFTVYLVLDQGLALGAVVDDILKRKFILAGFAALVLLTPLALTSTQGSVRRLGFQKWQRLHRLAYVAGALGATHFILRVKADLREPLVYATLIGAGLVVRALQPQKR